MIWHLRFAIGAALVATVTSVSLSQENQPKTYEENAKNFAFGKLGFSMTLNEFKREFPRAQIGKGTDEKIGFYHYALDDPQNAASGIAVWFFEGKLLEIGIFYNKDLDRRLEKIGGAKVLLDRLEQKFGKFNPLDYSDDRGKRNKDNLAYAQCRTHHHSH
ncbi:MAG: hypothetical protein K2X38_23020 [Gemmataceae bacterium]|nr:hypothetical protein [Gemmataceae bacterium]